MLLRLPAAIRTIDDALDLYRRPDEEVLSELIGPAGFVDCTVAQFCAEARPAHGVPLEQLVAWYRPRMVDQSVRPVQGGVAWFGECSFRPGQRPMIAVNHWLIGEIVRLGAQLAAPPEAVWFEPEMLTRLVVAHELHHIHHAHQDWASPLSGWHTELAAHVFARSLTGWRYSPLIFHSLLKFVAGQDGREEKMLEALPWN